jgi:mono/diheme cytochrome c family protein
MADPVKDAAGPKPLTARFYRWFNERTGINGVMHASLDETFPGGARLAYVFGSGLLFIFISQVITGLCLALYYVPSAESAHTSVAYITKQVAAGQFLRSLHYYGSSAMIIVLLLHFLQTFLYGSFKGRRELLWISGALLSFLVLGMGFTGYLLPWDQSAYFATAVGTNIAGEVSFIGQWLTNMLRGGDTLGTLTLSRFYVADVFLIPGMNFVFIGLHIALFRKAGAAGPISESTKTSAAAAAGEAIFQAQSCSRCHGEAGAGAGKIPPMSGLVAKLSDTQIAKLIQAPNATMKAGGMPPVEAPPGEFKSLVAYLRSLAPGQTAHGFAMPQGTNSLSPAPSAPSSEAAPAASPEAAKTGAAPTTSAADKSPTPAANAPDSAGRGLFVANGCMACHGKNAQGTHFAPSLINITKLYPPAQLINLLHHPKPSMRAGGMPAVMLNDAQMKDLVAYLSGLGEAPATAPAAAGQSTQTAAIPPAPGNTRSEAAAPKPAPAVPLSADAVRGKTLFERNRCETCHGVGGLNGTVAAPGLAGMASMLPASVLDNLLQHHSTQMKNGHMPPTNMNPASRKAIVSYIRSMPSPPDDK